VGEGGVLDQLHGVAGGGLGEIEDVAGGVTMVSKWILDILVHLFYTGIEIRLDSRIWWGIYSGGSYRRCDMLVFQQREDKMRELVLYVSLRCQQDRWFGKVKLNKLLFFADFFAYGKLGTPITGFEYQALDQGPAPRRMVPLLTELEQENALVFQVVPVFNYEQRRPIALRNPNLSQFSGEEIALVDEVVAQYWDLTATQISNLSHELDGWKLVDIGETIPYHTVFRVNNDIPEAAFDYARELEALLA
jgi:hypothetical protein